MTCAVHTDQLATAYCRTCGKALCQSCQRDVRGVIYCQDCLAARLEGTVPPAAANTPQPVYVAPTVGSASPGLAAVLGFIPGVGAFYNGQFAKGFVHVFVFAILVHLADRADWFGMVVAAWIFYMVFDAYTTAKARMLGQPSPDHLGLNALLAGFGLGATPHPATAAAGTANVNPIPSGSPDIGANPGPGFVSAESSAAVPGEDPIAQRACAPGIGGMPIGAIILIALGVMLLLDNLGVASFRWMGEFWPIILIVLGLWLAARRLGKA